MSTRESELVGTPGRGHTGQAVYQRGRHRKWLTNMSNFHSTMSHTHNSRDQRNKKPIKIKERIKYRDREKGETQNKDDNIKCLTSKYNVPEGE
jgi:hypothetical protein